MHQRSIYKQAHEHELQNEANQKEKLMAKAKAAWLNRNLPASEKKDAGGMHTIYQDFSPFLGFAPTYGCIYLNPNTFLIVITNPDDPKFDLEKYLMSIEASDMKSRAKA